MLSSKGFTLIELIVVIILLGILSVAVAPKFIDVSVEAKVATLNTMAGALSSGAKIVYGKAAVQNKVSASDSIDLYNTTIELYSGYPVAKTAALKYVVGLEAFDFGSTPFNDCDVQWCGVGNISSSSAYTSLSIEPGGRYAIFFLEGYKYSDECFAYYVNPLNGSFPETGTITDGC